MTTALFEASLLHEIEQLKRRMYQLEHRRSLTYDTTGSVNFPQGISIGDASPIFVDEDVPAPTGLTVSKGTLFERVFIDVSWTASAGTGSAQVVEYEVKLTETEFGVSQYVRTAGTATRFEGLKPEKQYSVEVRALNRLGRSSALLGPSTITTDKDASVPGKVANVIATAGAKSITARWDERTEADMINGKGLYQVEIATNSGFTSGFRMQRTSATIASWTDLVTGQQYWVRVMAIDSSGNPGAYSDTTAQSTATPGKITNADASTASGAITDSTVPASSPTPTVTGGPGYLYASWTPIGNNDPVTYEVHMSTTSGFTPAAGTKVGETSGSFFFIRRTAAGGALANATTYYVKILSRDADGPATAASAEGSGQLSPVGDADLSGTAPSVPTSLSTTPGVIANTSEGFIDFSWTQSGTVGSWEVRYKRSTESAYSYLVTATNGVRLRALLPGTTYNLSVRAISKVGAQSAFATDVNAAIPNDTTNPGVVSGVLVGAGLRTVTMRWTDVSIPDLDYYEAQIATDSGFTANLQTVRTKGTIVSFGDRAARTEYWVRVKAVDTSGNPSGGAPGTWSAPTPASVTTAAVENADIVGGTISGDRIIANDIDSGQIKANAVTADELAALNLAVGKYIRSNVYTAGSAGWAINAAGDAEFNNVVVRGTIGAGTVSETLDVGASQVKIDGPGRVITITDTQATPVVRVSLGKLSTGSTDYGLLVRNAAGQVMFSATDEGVTQYGIKTDAVVSGKINADAVGAREIAAAAITTEHLTVGAANPSMALNGSFEDTKESDTTKPAEWIQGTTSTGSTWTRHTTAANVHSGTASLALAVTGTTSEQSVDSETLFPVVGGEYYELSAFVKSSVASADGFYLRVYWYKADGTAASTASLDAASNVATTTTFAKQAAILQAPADAARAKIRIYNYQPATVCTMYVDSVEIRRAVGVTTITPNAITTGMIQTGQINSDHIISTGIHGTKITFDTLDGDRILANTLDADKIKTSEIYSAVITVELGGMLRIGRSSSPFHYMTLDDSGLKFYRNGTAAFTGGGNPAAEFNVSTGATNITLTDGSIRTDTQGARVEMDAAGLRLFNANDPDPTVDLRAASGTAIFKGQVDATAFSSVGPALLSAGFRTGDSGARVLGDSEGLKVFPASSGGASYRSHTGNYRENGTSLLVNKPGGTVQGDLLVSAVSWRDTSTPQDVVTLTPPPGWTQLYYNNNLGPNKFGTAIYVKVAGASEPATYTYTTNTNAYFHVVHTAYSNVDATTPYGTLTVAAYTDATGVTPDGAYSIVANSVTPTVGSLVAAMYTTDAYAYGSFSSADMTFRVNLGKSTTVAVFDFFHPTGTATGNKTATQTLPAGYFRKNALGFLLPIYGTGSTPTVKANSTGVIDVLNATTVPSTNLTGGGRLYSEAGLPKWRSSGGGVYRLGELTEIERIILAADTSAGVTFSNIPTNFRDLLVVARVRFNSGADVGVRFNGDFGGNYHFARIIGQTTNNKADSYIDGGQPGMRVGYSQTTTAGEGSQVVLHVIDYRSTLWQKAVTSHSHAWGNLAPQVRIMSGGWQSASAITSLTVYGFDGQTMEDGSTVTLYGMGMV